MTTQEIADQLVSKLKAGDFMGAYDLFDQEKAKHYEPKSPVVSFRNLTGIQAIKEKDQAMASGIAKVSLPEIDQVTVKSNVIALNYKMALELKDGNALNLDEVIVYEVENGKIISENIFY